MASDQYNTGIDWEVCPVSSCGFEFEPNDTPPIHLADEHSPEDFAALKPTEDLRRRPYPSEELIEP